MKNSHIHNGLPRKEIRDFLAIAIIKSFAAETKIQKDREQYKNAKGIEWAIKDAEAEIICWQKKLECYKEKASIFSLIKMNGWDEFDVSDETEKDLDYSLKMNFIGTQKEYENFLKSIKK